ncbi:DUF3231 family protein [Cohnella panacarvi]|uniref:DUF3231 family protein n=1 Tax=Cohnella panacarvi TaxID=400776 RepID=UPI00047A63F1|nr:DUF3231 family protein [Cohnella panacarvi]
MVNIFEAAVESIKSLTDDKDPKPLHVGEVMSCWVYLAGLELAHTTVQSGISMTTDSELLALLEEDLALGTSQRNRLRAFMLQEGITLPESSEDLPRSDPNAVPLGARMPDGVLANELVLKIASLILQAAGSAIDSLRTDVALLFIQFQAEKLMFAAKLKTAMQKRGWLNVPPAFVPPGAPTRE